MDTNNGSGDITQSNEIYEKHINIPFIIAIIVLIIAITMVFISIIYLLFWRPVPPSPSCETNNDCSNGQVCQLGNCIEIICNSNADCNNNDICIKSSSYPSVSYCYPLNCNMGNDCPTGMACISGTCISVGTPCQSNSDCQQLTCMNNVCVQCSSDSTCPIGQGCFGQTCRYPYKGDTGSNMINYYSPAQINGNIVAPPGYFCSNTDCGVENLNFPLYCGNTRSCPNKCPYCVNNFCRCTPGQIYEECRSNSDCISGLCSQTLIGNICVPDGGECAFNYNGTGCLGCCSITNPYCVNGKCSNVSLGAICGGTGLPLDMCSNPLSLGAIGTTGISNNGMGFFCVNGSCQNSLYITLHTKIPPYATPISHLNN